MAEPWVRNQRLPPTLSNLLPEGALREWLAQTLKTHQDNEFPLLSWLGQDLPGAIIASPLAPSEVPAQLLAGHARAVQCVDAPTENKFSLAGVQMKFSMKETDSRYNLSNSGQLGDWIIKTPSTRHPFVPLNEFTAMSLAALAGVDIPDIRLIELNQLQNLPPINLPDEKLAFGIRRYDREGNQRIHAEDFAQVLMKYPHDKYEAASYEQLGHIIYNYSGDGLADIQQFARRLLVNILLANGDAHLKNWSLIYPDQITPRLSPAYDILTTRVHIKGESRFALNLGKTKSWYSVILDHFQHWAEKAGIPWKVIKPHFADVVSKAKTLWPNALHDLPMDDRQKQQLREHWALLQKAFRI